MTNCGIWACRVDCQATDLGTAGREKARDLEAAARAAVAACLLVAPPKSRSFASLASAIRRLSVAIGRDRPESRVDRALGGAPGPVPGAIPEIALATLAPGRRIAIRGRYRKPPWRLRITRG